MGTLRLIDDAFHLKEHELSQFVETKTKQILQQQKNIYWKTFQLTNK